ncbi:MAG: hypothetical protein JWP52_4489, partial [Rhizobacter sp.]|nr:hypothetical protein [Rhizobacter sp.]
MATETPPAETALTSIATAMGTHAVTGFAVMLPLVLLLVAALWWTVRRYGVPRQTSRLPPAA